MARKCLIGDAAASDIEEMREIAAWFGARGDPLNQKFLQDAATRYEIISSAYGVALSRQQHEVAAADFDAEKWKRENL